jgi:hypothetical protein
MDILEFAQIPKVVFRIEEKKGGGRKPPQVLPALKILFLLLVPLLIC